MATSSNQNNIELSIIRSGYPALAAWIARDVDNETLVFRKFDRLSSRNLLHLQSQLIQLEHEIDELDTVAARSSDDDTFKGLRRWEKFIELASDPNRPENERLQKANDLSDKIKEYRTCIELPLSSH
jgi:hypothetical protein